MLLVKNIKELIQVRENGIKFLKGKEMSELPTIKNAFLLVSDGIIEGYGSMNNCPEEDNLEVIDASGKMRRMEEVL